MSKSLVIVESPAKAKTINKYLGANFVVKSSVGHIRDLPVSGRRSKVDLKERAKQAALTRKMAPDVKAKYKKKKAYSNLVKSMGVDPENDWSATYEILPNKANVVGELKNLATTVDTIYLATDLDREGEAIAWHLKEVIGGDDSRYRRVVFNEITKTAIQQAFEQPGTLNNYKVEAQQTRRFLDRIVGFMISPLLWAKIARGLSAGRVQSVAVRLLVEREREVRVFVPEEYWEVYADTECERQKLRLQVVKETGENFRPARKEEADTALASLQKNRYEVTARDDRPTRSKPNAPLITSTMQQAASTRLGFSVKKTMMLAQRLYEAGYITYMRTDSTNLSIDAIRACRNLILGQYGKEYLPQNSVFYASKEGAQDAHEAIRPTDVYKRGSEISVERDQRHLYDLIRNYFLACQMTNAEYLSSMLTVTSGRFELRAKGRILKFDGHTRALPPAGKQDNLELPDLKIGQVLSLQKLDSHQNFTRPPARYTEASLVKELEKRGIGRPSTYASIISTIQDRGYATIKNRRFFAEKMGEIVTDRLTENFSNLMDYGFTAGMEETLDEIADGGKDWKTVLTSFYADLKKKLDTAAGDGEGKYAIGGMRANLPTNTDIECQNCGRHLQIRNGATGVFLGCSGYGLPQKERCTQTMNLVTGDEVEDAQLDEETEARQLVNKRRCPVCHSAMEEYLIDEKRKIHICGDSPDCSGYEIEQGEFKLKGYDGAALKCDKCESDMQLQTGRFGKYFRCTNESCKNTRKLLKSGEVAPPKADPIPMPHLRCEKVDDFYLLRDGASGIFLAASQFPKNRETRAPLVEEILSIHEQLDPKYQFLVSAPVTDPVGNKAQIRYSRKTKEQYVSTEVSRRATGWKAFYRNGDWVTEVRAKPKTKAKKKIRKKNASIKGASKKKTTKKNTTKKAISDTKTSIPRPSKSET
jgi:DNA topoisomerase-1